jgi:hypothetical protein
MQGYDGRRTSIMAMDVVGKNERFVDALFGFHVMVQNARADVTCRSLK